MVRTKNVQPTKGRVSSVRIDLNREALVSTTNSTNKPKRRAVKASKKSKKRVAVPTLRTKVAEKVKKSAAAAILDSNVIVESNQEVENDDSDEDLFGETQNENEDENGLQNYDHETGHEEDNGSSIIHEDEETAKLRETIADLKDALKTESDKYTEYYNKCASLNSDMAKMIHIFPKGVLAALLADPKGHTIGKLSDWRGRDKQSHSLQKACYVCGEIAQFRRDNSLTWQGMSKAEKNEWSTANKGRWPKCGQYCIQCYWLRHKSDCFVHTECLANHISLFGKVAVSALVPAKELTFVNQFIVAN